MLGQILVVEDDPVTGRLLEKTLAATGRAVRLAGSAAEAAEALAAAPTNLIILDLVLPDVDGRALLASWRSAHATAQIPVIVLTVSGGPEIRNECLALGASAFVEKPFDVAGLSATVENVLSQPSAAEDPARDVLTGLTNRAGVYQAYDRIRSTMPEDIALSVALVDLDHFRAVNESCGRTTADAVLVGVARMLGMSVANEQTVGRWQGDRFVALLPGVAKPQAAEWLERCLAALSNHSFTSEQGGNFTITFSAGVTESSGNGLDDAIGVAEGCLYAAKSSGRNKVVSCQEDATPPGGKVLLADDDPVVARIVKQVLQSEGLDVEHHADGASALAAAHNERIKLFLLDINMPEADGFEVLRELRSDPAYAKVPIAMLTGMGDEDSIARAFELGADDYLVKPVSSHELVAKVHRLLTRWVETRLQELQGSGLYVRGLELLDQVFKIAIDKKPLPIKDLSTLTLQIVAELKTNREKLLGQVMNPTVFEEEYLAQHSLNSAILATIVGQELGFEGDDLDWLCMAAMLHEIGCILLPEGLLLKAGKISDEERALIQMRPEFSYEIIKKLAPDCAEAAEIALQVHERPDGTGYPKGLSGDEIRLEAQILSAVEVFEALTHHRPYRDQPQAASDAVKSLLDSANTHFLDRVLKALITKIGLYPVGSYVKLGTDEVALVLEHREANPMRPLLAVVSDRSGKPLAAPRVTDPMLNPQINISRSVPPPQIGTAA